MVVWLQEHQLNIAKEKCFSLTLARKKSTHNPNHFSINSNSISNKTHFRDLGVIISDDLKWTHHVNSICTSAEVKSYQILKCFKTKNIGVLLRLFKTYVRPKLEYNTPVWSPYLLKNVNKIESVQRNYTKRICRRCGINFSSYEDRLNILNLNTLEKRRAINDLLLLYKMIHNLIDLKFTDYFSFTNIKYNLRRNSMQIQTKKKINLPIQPWQISFFMRVIKFWNALPEDIVTAQSISIFKLKLQTFCLSSIINMKITTIWTIVLSSSC